MKRMKTIKYTNLGLLFIWGFVSFLFIAGDEHYSDPQPLVKFIFVKGCALLSLGLCFLTGNRLGRKGQLPDVSDNDKELFK